MAVIEEARERIPALAHIVNGFEIGHRRRAELLADGLALSWALAVDRPLDLEQGVNPADRFQRQRRDHCRLLALSLATRVLGQISHHKERTPGVNPTSGF